MLADLPTLAAPGFRRFVRSPCGIMIPHLIDPITGPEMLYLPPKPKRPRIRKRGARVRCDAFNKTIFERPSPSGYSRMRSPRCRAWAMPNGRCRLHGGLSTGPKTADGKAIVVSAMLAGRQAWVAKLRAEGSKVPGGRKAAAAWITVAMLQRADAEARRLGGGLPQSGYSSLVLMLLRSAKGDLKAETMARAVIAAAKSQVQERLFEEAKEVIRNCQVRRAADRQTNRALVVQTSDAAAGTGAIDPLWTSSGSDCGCAHGGPCRFPECASCYVRTQKTRLIGRDWMNLRKP
jgi:hypothetical protein